MSQEQILNNHANQCNPNHIPSGPGRWAGYHGTGDWADLNNHSRQLNPQDIRYRQSREQRTVVRRRSDSSERELVSDDDDGASLGTLLAVGAGLAALAVVGAVAFGVWWLVKKQKEKKLTCNKNAGGSRETAGDKIKENPDDGVRDGKALPSGLLYTGCGT